MRPGIGAHFSEHPTTAREILQLEVQSTCHMFVKEAWGRARGRSREQLPQNKQRNRCRVRTTSRICSHIPSISLSKFRVNLYLCFRVSNPTRPAKTVQSRARPGADASISQTRCRQSRLPEHSQYDLSCVYVCVCLVTCGQGLRHARRLHRQNSLVTRLGMEVCDSSLDDDTSSTTTSEYVTPPEKGRLSYNAYHSLLSPARLDVVWGERDAMTLSSSVAVQLSLSPPRLARSLRVYTSA